jgi:hypothetical protein
MFHLIAAIGPLMTLAGTYFGVAEKGVSLAEKGASITEKSIALFNKLRPSKDVQEDGVLVELAKQLPIAEREQAVMAMKSVYATLASAAEHVRRLQRQQLLASLNRLLQRTFVLVTLAFVVGYLLKTDSNRVALGVGIVFFAVGALNGWFVKIHVPKADLAVGSLIAATPEKVTNLLSDAFKMVEEDSSETARMITPGPITVLGEAFLDSYDQLMARIEALQLYCLRLKFVQSNDDLRSYMWASLEEAIVDAIARMVANDDIKPMPASSSEVDGWREDQKNKIENCLKDTGVADMFLRPWYTHIWESDLATPLGLPNGKADLLRKLRQASKVPTFSQF